MAQEVYVFSITIPAGGPGAPAQTFDLTIPTRYVRRVEFQVPPGPRGQVGFALATGGQTIIPEGNFQWIIADDEYIKWDIDNQIDSGAWQLIGYNAGLFDHTIYVRFLADPVAVRTPPLSLQPLAL